MGPLVSLKRPGCTWICYYLLVAVLFLGTWAHCTQLGVNIVLAVPACWLNLSFCSLLAAGFANILLRLLLTFVLLNCTACPLPSLRGVARISCWIHTVWKLCPMNHATLPIPWWFPELGLFRSWSQYFHPQPWLRPRIVWFHSRVSRFLSFFVFYPVKIILLELFSEGLVYNVKGHSPCCRLLVKGGAG